MWAKIPKIYKKFIVISLSVLLLSAYLWRYTDLWAEFDGWLAGNDEAQAEHFKGGFVYMRIDAAGAHFKVMPHGRHYETGGLGDHGDTITLHRGGHLYLSDHHGMVSYEAMRLTATTLTIKYRSQMHLQSFGGPANVTKYPGLTSILSKTPPCTRSVYRQSKSTNENWRKSWMNYAATCSHYKLKMACLGKGTNGSCKYG